MNSNSKKRFQVILSRVGNRPSVTWHQPNRGLRIFDVVSSHLDHKGWENGNRPSEICAKNSHPISSSRSNTDETNRFSWPNYSHRNCHYYTTKCSFPVMFLFYFNCILIPIYICITGCHRKSITKTFKKHFSCDKSIISSLSSCVWFRLGIFRRTISNCLSKNLLKNPRPSVLRP